jgi:Tol biopolymer transport system component
VLPPPPLSPRTASFWPTLSDRPGDGNLEIYLQQIPGGQPLRLTNHPANDTDPAFSPDSRSIAFHSARDGGGVYVIPALGGDARLLAAGGQRPRYSPDGAWIAYHTGGWRSYVIPGSGGPPLQVGPGLTSAGMPVWSPDGERLLVLVYGRHRQTDWDWWVVLRLDLAAAERVPTGVWALFSSQGLLELSPGIVPGDWRGDEVLFSTVAGPYQDVSLWRLPVSANSGKATGKPQRLTTGARHALFPYTAADGSFVFAQVNLNFDLWSLPANTAEDRPTGELQRLTQDAAIDVLPSVSADGTKLAFASDRSGTMDIWIKDLVGGKETALTASPAAEVYPVISADGSRVAYRSGSPVQSSVYTISTAGGAPEKACDNCGVARGWTSDKTSLLLTGYRLLPLATKQPVAWSKGSRLRVFFASLSPDDRWVALATFGAGSATAILVAPMRHDPVVEESEWIAITDGSANDGGPRGAPTATGSISFRNGKPFAAFGRYGWTHSRGAPSIRPPLSRISTALVGRREWTSSRRWLRTRSS